VDGKGIDSLAITSIGIRGASEGTKIEATLECKSLAEKLCRPTDASKWELASPVRTKADDRIVNEFLKSLANLSATDSIDLSTDSEEKRASLLADYGLSEDRLEKTANEIRLAFD